MRLPQKLKATAKAGLDTAARQIKNMSAQGRHSQSQAFALLEFQSPSHAVTHAPVPLFASRMTWIVASLLVVMVIIMGVRTVDEVVIARGIVVSKTPNFLIQSLEPALIKSILVREGERVVAGQLLAKLDPTFAVADVDTLTSQLRSVRAEIARLNAESENKDFAGQEFGLEGQLQLAIFNFRKGDFAARIENYNQRINQLRSTKESSDLDQSAYRERLDVAKDIESMRKTLEAKQAGSRLSTLLATDNRAELARALTSAEKLSEGTQRDMAAVESEKTSFIQSWFADISQKLSDANFRLNDLHEQLNKANRKNELVEIHAQEPGIVQSIAKVSVGSVLAPGQPFMTVVSTANGLEIEANIPGADSGFVKTGDEVAIKFDTLPFATYGMYHGLVKIISPDAFTPQREMVNPTGAMPAESNEPYYRSVIDLTKSELHNLPVGFELVPGMPVVTDIKVGERSVLSYFLQKIVPIFKEGLREP